VLERYREHRRALTGADVAEIFRLRGARGRRGGPRRDPHRRRRSTSSKRSAADGGRVRAPRRREHLEAFDTLNNEFHMVIARAAAAAARPCLASSLELPASIFALYREPVDDRTRRTHWQHREIIGPCASAARTGPSPDGRL
jgi:DNA-binding GntR family transcriptional regulator